MVPTIYITRKAKEIRVALGIGNRLILLGGNRCLVWLIDTFPQLTSHLLHPLQGFSFNDQVCRTQVRKLLACYLIGKVIASKICPWIK